ncbi:uncharacterized protein LOC105932628 [Fundulus heteroclitus]|uniref:uncharacterized protein LOC105932628 n=1 Tax=Fundulus heteroclitus TaxID=8078 RepID=UPI00165B1970|nr:uncharacterized protein LOC105932628 [Fundulus heteroclitus]XP_035983007.1 uncharacterized protein LOC105932628 [Fundulus heteroclitus]
MSQSSNPADTQALLQSMLQRLKLQPGREGQTHFQTPVSPSAAPALWPNGETGAPGLQEVTSSPVNVFNFNGSPSTGITVPAGFKSEEKQPTSPAFEGSRSPTSFPLQKVGTDGDTGEKRELDQAPHPRFSPTSTRPLFPTKPQKEVKLTFFKKTNVEREPIGNSMMTGQIPASADSVQELAQRQNHVPVWSVTSAGPGLAGGGHAGFHVGNGGTGSLEQNKDVQVFSSSQITTSKTRKRSTESKTRRWTQKIKERFKDRHGNVGKKGKEEGIPEQETQVIRAETPGNRTNNDEDCSRKLHPAQTEDNTMSNNRRSSDLDIGLGSFSLLEEIVQGQEWAKFINPNFSTTSGTERPSQDPSSQPHAQPNPHSLNLSPGSLNPAGTGSNQWSFRSTESSPAPAFSMPPPAPVFPPAPTDTSALKQQADQPEPMEDGQNRSEMLSRLQLKLSAFAETSGNPYHSIVRNRLQMSRKRQHQPAERREERLQTQRASDGEKTDKGPLCSPSSASIQMMEESVEPQQESVSPPHEPRPHPIPLSPTSFNPAALPPRSVLRQKAPHDSESSIETLTKRRRVEEKRQVHFCEQVTTIESADMDFTDSEEDSGADEDSSFEPDFEAVQAEMDEALPARRSNLPAWIQALKKMNAGKKHR